jgi:hypothetical protein
MRTPTERRRVAAGRRTPARASEAALYSPPSADFAHYEVLKDLVDECIDLSLDYRQSGHPGGSRSKVHMLLALLLSGAMRWDIRRPWLRFATASCFPPATPCRSSTPRSPSSTRRCGPGSSGPAIRGSPSPKTDGSP